MYNQLGQSGVARQTGSMAASFVAKTGSSYVAGIMGAGSAAGPIGAVIGAVVSGLMALFGGAKVKDPVFGLVALIPESDQNALRVGRMLDLLSKRAFDMGYTWGIKNKNTLTQLHRQILGLLDSPPVGALGITSGGLPTSHPQVAGLDFGKIQNHTSALGKPFHDTLNLITDQQIKTAILNAILPFKTSKSYYFQIGESKGEAKPESKNRWSVAGIAQKYDAVKISGGEGLAGSLNKAWKSIPENINETFMRHAGFDVLSGIVINKELADKAFKPTIESTLKQVISTPWGWLIILGGLFVLGRGGNS